MPKFPGTPIDFYKNTSGMMPVFGGPAIPLTGCRRAKNVNYFPVGGFSRRAGYSRDNTTAQDAGIQTGLYEIALSSGTRTFVGTCNTKIGVRAAGVASWTDKTGSLTITAGQNNLFSFAILDDTTVCCNDVDTVIQLNSSLTAAVLAGTPAFTSALFPVEFRGYMFYGNTVESSTRQPDRLRFSDNGTANTFTATNFIDVHKKQGGQLRGACVFRELLCCWKENGIYAISYQPTRVASNGTAFPFIQNPNPIVAGVGAQSHRTIVPFTTPETHEAPGEYVFFVDQYGMPRVMNSAFQTMRVGYPISMCRDTTVLTLASMTRSVSALRSQFAVNYPERNQIWVFMHQTTQMDTVWVLDYTVGWAWSYFIFDTSFTCATLGQHTDGTFRVYTGDRSGFMCRQDTGNLDNTTAISWLYETGDAYYKSVAVRCNWPFFECRGTTPDQTQNISTAFVPDGNDLGAATNSFTLSSEKPLWGAATSIWGQFDWAKTGTVNKTLNPGFDAKTIRVKYQDVDGSNGLLEGWTFAAKPEGAAYE